jgi:Hint module/Vault protein inter-alpha-trypsin domain/von Willebrand factor type A domain
MVTDVHGYGGLVGYSDRQKIFFPLRSVYANATISDGIAKVSMQQIFEIVTKSTLGNNWTAGYEIPFDEQGAIFKFKASYADRIVEGIVKSDDEAQKEFDDAVNEGKPAFLGKKASAGVFKIDFGNVPFNVLLTIEFQYITTVQARDRETLRFVIPSTLAPGMNPKKITSDSDILGYDNGVFTLNVNAFSSFGFKGVSSPTHNVTVTDVPGDGKQIAVVDLQAKRRDIVIILRSPKVSRPDFTVFNEIQSDGSSAFMLTALPDTSSFNVEAAKTEYIFLIDRSGSMEGSPIIQTKMALEVVLKNLPSGSIFNLVNFGSSFDYAFSNSILIDNSQQLNEAILFVQGIYADYGGTDMFSPLKGILLSNPTKGYARVVLVISDGFADDVTNIIKFVGKNRGSTRVFTLGIGDSDRELVNGIARTGGGTAEYVDSSNLDQLTEVAMKQVEVITQANYMSQFSIQWGTSMKGVRVPFGNRIIFGERRSTFFYLTNEIVDFVKISGLVGGKIGVSYNISSVDFVSTAKLPNNPVPFVGPMAAREAIRDLEDDMSALHSKESINEEAVKNEIIRIGVKYQIASTETSFIAIDNQGWTSISTAPGSAPPVGGGGGIGIGFCFSGDNMVLTKDYGYVKMANIQIGDMVSVGPNKFSRVFGFGHRNDITDTTYLQIFTSNTKPLEISHDHMLFVQNQRAIPASSVKIGDNIVLGNAPGAVGIVRKISTVKRTGAYAPFTEVGTIVVNDVLASNYISLQENSSFFEVAGIKIVSMHWLAHASQAPYRLISRVGLCKKESYTSEGISKWVYGPFLVSKWLVEQHPTVLMIFAIPIVVICMMFYIMEKMLTIDVFFLFLFVLILLRCVKGKTMTPH